MGTVCNRNSESDHDASPAHASTAAGAGSRAAGWAATVDAVAAGSPAGKEAGTAGGAPRPLEPPPEALQQAPPHPAAWGQVIEPQKSKACLSQTPL